MERDRRPLYVWWLFVLADALVWAYYWPRLPHILAQHFGADGRPNGWATKESFFFFMGALVLGMGAIFFGLPKLLRAMPFSLVNIPYKSYWEATPERQLQAWDITEQHMNWIGLAVVALLSLTAHLVIRANLTGGPLGNAQFVTVLVAFFGFMLGWAIAFIRRFKPPDSPQT
jgi:uncharacterized membrane protein